MYFNNCAKECVMIKIIKRFKLGRIIPIGKVIEIIKQNKDYQEWTEYCLSRYASMDWGSIGDNYKIRNEKALKNKERVIARYSNPAGNILILTEGGATTVLLQDEYRLKLCK
jgi:hypothetical protein